MALHVHFYNLESFSYRTWKLNNYCSYPFAPYSIHRMKHILTNGVVDNPFPWNFIAIHDVPVELSGLHMELKLTYENYIFYFSTALDLYYIHQVMPTKVNAKDFHFKRIAKFKSLPEFVKVIHKLSSELSKVEQGVK